MGMPNFPQPNDLAALPNVGMPGVQPQIPPMGDPNFPMAAPPELGLAPAIPAQPQQQFPQQVAVPTGYAQPQQQFASAPPVGMPPVGQASFAPDYTSQPQQFQQPTLPAPMGELPPPMPQVAPTSAPATPADTKINWKTLQTQVKNGEHDAHLDQLWASDEREGVRKAITARKAVLSGTPEPQPTQVTATATSSGQYMAPELVVYVPVPVSKLGHILPQVG